MGRTKALIDVDGAPMAARVARALSDAGCAPVLAYGGDPAELSPIGLPVLADRSPGAGPLGAVLGLLERYERNHGDTWLFVVACDLPWLTGRDLAPMVEAAHRYPGAEVVVARTASVEPTCAIWRAAAAAAPVRASFEAGERAVHVVIERLESIEVELDATALRNINTPADLDRYP